MVCCTNRKKGYYSAYIFSLNFNSHQPWELQWLSDYIFNNKIVKMTICYLCLISVFFSVFWRCASTCFDNLFSPIVSPYLILDITLREAVPHVVVSPLLWQTKELLCCILHVTIPLRLSTPALQLTGGSLWESSHHSVFMLCCLSTRSLKENFSISNPLCGKNSP